MSMDAAAKRRSIATPSPAEWNGAAANVVANMYRGPSGEHATPGSPGLVSPRNSFFAFRNPSGGAVTVASIAEDEPAEKRRWRRRGRESKKVCTGRAQRNRKCALCRYTITTEKHRE